MTNLDGSIRAAGSDPLPKSGEVSKGELLESIIILTALGVIQDQEKRRGGNRELASDLDKMVQSYLGTEGSEEQSTATPTNGVAATLEEV